MVTSVSAQPASTRSGIPVRGLWLLGAVALFWGANWPIMKMVLFEWNVWHFRTVSLVMGCTSFFALGKLMGYSLRVPPGEWGRLLTASFFNVTCWQIFSGFGVSLLASGRASVVGYTMPLWVVPLSMWLLHEPMTRRKLAGLALGFLGLLLLIGDDLVRLQQAPLGTLAMLAAAFTWAIGIVFIKRYPVTLATTVFTGWMMLLGGIPVLLGALLFGGSEFKPLSGRALLALAYVIFVAMVFCHWGFLRLVRMLPATITGISSLTVPVVGVFSGMLMLGEKPGAAEWGALALILCALAVILIPSRSNPQSPKAAVIVD
ncbi:MAG: DMT family transporter [Burkholderiales bacterium]|nr:DMT family transporter [Burkholderiales bacterium]